MRAVNLIPAEQRGGGAVGAGRSRGGAHAVLALLAGLALMALLYGVAHHQVASRRTQAAAVTAQAQEAQAAASRLAPYTSFIAMRETRMQAVVQLVNSRFDWAHVFHEFGRVLPSDVSFSSLSGTIGAPGPAGSSATGAGGAVSSATPPGSIPTFTLAGCATSQPAVAQMLQRLRLIDGVSEVTLQSSTTSSPAGGGATGGGCGTHGASFAAQVTFEALPSVAAASAAAKTVAATSTTSTTTGTASK